MLAAAGLDPVAAEELTVLPGAEEVLALLELRLHAASGRWDVVVVDCAPTAETLRLLALPEALGWYIDRVLPVERRVVKALRPVLTRAAGVPMPGDTVFDAVVRLHAELDEVRELLTGPEATVRIVLTPESVVLAEARRSWTTLSLYGYRVDGVVANRVFPAEGADDWRAGWVVAQDAVLAEVEESFAGLPLWRSEYRPGEPVGVEALRELAAETYAGADPLAVPEGAGPFRVTSHGPGDARGTVLHLALPLVGRADVDLARNGDDLVVTVGSYRRLLTVPAGLARHRVAGARVEDGELQVRFREQSLSRRRGRARGPCHDAARTRWGRRPRRPPSCSAPWPTGPATTAADLGTAVGGLAGQASAAAHDVDAHLATGEECRYCPVCRAVQLSTGPRRPRSASTWRRRPASLAQAAAAALATTRARGRRQRRRAHRPDRRLARRAATTARRGRRVSLTCGVDVGGTKILGGVVDEDGTVVEELRVVSPATDVAAIEDAITGLVTELAGRHQVEAVGVGAAGYIDKSRSVVMFAPNLAWRDLDLRAELEDRVGLPVVVENDANAAAWGEFRFGAGEDVDDLLLVTVGTGVGGGVVLDGRLHRGAFGVGGEIGHMRVVPGGVLCGCGNRGCLESYGSGTALVREARAAAAGGSPLVRAPARPRRG